MALPKKIFFDGLGLEGTINLGYAKRDSVFLTESAMNSTNIENLVLDYTHFKLITPIGLPQRGVEKTYNDLLRAQ